MGKKKKGQSQALGYSLDKAIECGKRIMLEKYKGCHTGVAAYGKGSQHFSQLGILKTTISCPITMPSHFCLSLCWCHFLWNCILKTLAWLELVAASLSVIGR